MRATTDRKVVDLRPNHRSGNGHNREHNRDNELVYEEGIGVGNGPIPIEIRKAVIMDRAKGVPSKIVAAKYDIRVGSVRSIWKEFAGTIGTRASDEDDPVRFKSKIRKKAIDAIENGLECDRDPYRQGTLGVKVMEGIGEFKGDMAKPGDVNFNIFVAGVPAEWRERYLGTKIGQIEEQTQIMELVSGQEPIVLPLDGTGTGADEERN